MQKSERVNNPVGVRLGLLLLFIGAALALDAFLDLSVVYRLWPLLVTMVGVGLVGIFAKGGFRVPMFLAAGVYLVCFSVLALYCNFTSWDLMADLWPLFVTFLGVVFLALCCFQKERHVYLLVGLLLVSASAVLYLTLNLSSRWWWTTFIFAGLSILVAEMSKWKSRLSS
jgi:hypothetical protein